MPPDPAPTTILVVDDDVLTRVLVGEALAAAGFAVVEAGDGEEAIALCDASPPALVLLDLHMPGLGGYEVCAALRASPTCATTPVLILTASDDVEAVERAFAVGATDFMTKPINLPLLAHRVRFMLRAAASAREVRESATRLVRAQQLARLVQWRLADGALTWSYDPLRAFWPDAPADVPPVADPMSLIHPDDLPAVAAAMRAGRPHELEFRLVMPDGTVRIVHQDAVHEDGRGGALIGATQDVTAARAAERQIAQLAFLDDLTGLPNRAFLHRYVRRILADARAPVAILAVDLGVEQAGPAARAASDDLLRAAAARVLEQVRGDDDRLRLDQAPSDPDSWHGRLVARVDGDELTVVIPGLDAAAAAELAGELADALARAVDVGGTELYLTPRLGVAAHADGGDDPRGLLARARAAMFHAHESALARVVVFDASILARAERRAEIDRLLHRAIAAPRPPVLPPEFDLRYQPKIDPASGLVTGVEALLRWRPPGHAPVGPDEFIPIAEASGLIVPLGAWVLRKACTQGARWIADGTPLRVAVNVSPRQLREPGFVDEVAAITRDTHFDPTLLELEITERAAVQEDDETLRVLHALRALGVRLVLDDFGVGYSALGYLSRLPIDVLKLDRAFLGAATTEAGTALPTAIVALARSLEIEVVAEGVETEAQAEFVTGLGVAEMQGYLYGAPMPATEVARMLAATGRAPAGDGNDAPARGRAYELPDPSTIRTTLMIQALLEPSER